MVVGKEVYTGSNWLWSPTDLLLNSGSVTSYQLQVTDSGAQATAFYISMPSRIPRAVSVL